MDKKKDARGYYQKGRSAAQENEAERAVVSYSRAIKLDKKNSSYLIGMANAVSKQERYEPASFLFKSVVAIDPRNDLGYYNLGIILEKLGKDDESLEMYQKALCLDPDDTDGHSNLANILTRKGRYKEAQEHYAKVLELKPSDTFQVLNCFGYSYFLQGDFAKAIPELHRSISLNEKDPFAYCNMSLVLFCEKDSEEALKYFEGGMKALEEDQSPIKILKEIIRSYASTKMSFEVEFNSGKMLNEEKRTLLRTMINGLTDIINLLTQRIDK